MEFSIGFVRKNSGRFLTENTDFHRIISRNVAKIYSNKKYIKMLRLKKVKCFYFISKIFHLSTSDFRLLNIFYKFFILPINLLESRHFCYKKFENFLPSIFVEYRNVMFFDPKSGNYFSVF